MEYIYSSLDEPILTIEEQETIVKWTKNNYINFDKNGVNRYKKELDNLENVPDCIWNIKKKIIEKEKLHDAPMEPILRDSIGYMTDGGQLHKHKDPNKDGLIHTRFNVYIQIPEKGGLPVYDEKVLKLKERTYICCRSGLDLHYCEKVEGPRERIILSFGFLLPFNRVSNIIYNYN